MWNHAEKVVKNASTEFDLIDAICSLKRAINHRLYTLKEIYLIEKISFKEFPTDKKKIRERLCILGIIKPLMLKKIIDIRNAIEHQDSKPPTKEICEEFIETVWYFLRSTDTYLRNVIETFSLIPNDSEFWYCHYIEEKTGPKNNWQVSLNGWVPNRVISYEQKKDFIKLNDVSIEKWGEFINRFDGRALLEDEKHRDLEDIYLETNICFPDEYVKDFYHLYFRVA
jgi:hypothetical protein